MSITSTFSAHPQKSYIRNAHFETAFGQAQAVGYISVQLPHDEPLIQKWSAWCAVHQKPIIQVCERGDVVWVAIDAVFCRTLLSKQKMTELHDMWQGFVPQPHALHGLTPMYCHFAGLDVRQAHKFALEIVRHLGSSA